MIVLLLAVLLGLDASLRLDVSPRVSVGPVSELHLRVRLTPSDVIRQLVVTGISDTFARSSAVSLDGEKARRVHDFWWTSIPCGAYGFSAATYDQGGHVLEQTTERATFCSQYEGL